MEKIFPFALVRQKIHDSSNRCHALDFKQKQNVRKLHCCIIAQYYRQVNQLLQNKKKKTIKNNLNIQKRIACENTGIKLRRKTTGALRPNLLNFDTNILNCIYQAMHIYTRTCTMYLRNIYLYDALN